MCVVCETKTRALLTAAASFRKAAAETEIGFFKTMLRRRAAEWEAAAVEIARAPRAGGGHASHVTRGDAYG